MKISVVISLICLLTFAQIARGENFSATTKRLSAIRDSLKAGNFVAISEAGPANRINDLVSDLLSDYKFRNRPQPFYYSQRIQVCTTNLINAANLPEVLSAYLPMEHVGILVDAQEVFTDSGGGGLRNAQERHAPIACAPAPVFVNKTEAQLVSLIKCIGAQFSYRSPYTFFGYNCGAFTRDVLLAAGMDMPVIPNAGIGMWFTKPLHQKTKNAVVVSRKYLIEEIVPNCNSSESSN